MRRWQRKKEGEKEESGIVAEFFHSHTSFSALSPSFVSLRFQIDILGGIDCAISTGLTDRSS